MGMSIVANRIVNDANFLRSLQKNLLKTLEDNHISLLPEEIRAIKEFLKKNILASDSIVEGKNEIDIPGTEWY